MVQEVPFVFIQFLVVLQLKSPPVILPCLESVTSDASYAPSHSISSLWHDRITV